MTHDNDLDGGFTEAYSWAAAQDDGVDFAGLGDFDYTAILCEQAGRRPSGRIRSKSFVVVAAPLPQPTLRTPSASVPALAPSAAAGL